VVDPLLLGIATGVVVPVTYATTLPAARREDRIASSSHALCALCPWIGMCPNTSTG